MTKLAPFDPPSDWVNSTDTETSHRYPDVYTELSPTQFNQVEVINEYTHEFRSQNGLKMRIERWRADIWRIRYTSRDFSRDFSYALTPTLAPVPDDVVLTETATHYLIQGSALKLSIAKTDGKLCFMTLENEEILRDGAPYLERSSIATGTHHLRLTFEAPAEEMYYGLGDKSWNLNLRGRHFQNWNSDSFGYGTDRDPLYRAIPFYYGVLGHLAYGMFFHNTGRTHFDFDSQADGLTRLWTGTGEVDYFFCYGPELTKVAQSYHYLTGKPELPPLWTLGFHQCRWSYYPESRVRDLAKEFRDRKIPCDAIYLDIDYMNGYRCFTWNHDYFPEPGKMIGDLYEQGFQTVVMIDPGIKKDPDYHVYQQGTEKDYFCRRTSGEVMEGPVWPPVCVWPDFTRPEVREWWGQLYQELYQQNGVSGFWNDMNEPAVFGVDTLTFPDNVMHDYDGAPCDHRHVHNIYGQQMARATYEGLKTLKPAKRPFVLTRATFSGGQRHAAVWTGDNVASWEHLAIANRQCQRLSISGYSIVGTDIGGFVDQPTPELLIRWIQLGVFHPVFRVHSMGNNIDGAAEADADAIKEAERTNRLDQEPWVFGEPYTSQARKAIEFRYQLLPYLYVSMWQHTQTGTPVLRSLAFLDQADAIAQKRENEFLLGEQLLVSPVTKEAATAQQTYLPKGNWLRYRDGQAYAGQRFVREQVDADSIPLYVRAGAIIPHYPIQQHVHEQKVTEVTLRTYYGSQAQAGQYYRDAGEGYEYQTDAYHLHTFSTEASDEQLRITQERQGAYDQPVETFIVQLYGLPFRPEKLQIDGVAHQIIDEIENGYELVVPGDFQTLEIGA